MRKIKVKMTGGYKYALVDDEDYERLSKFSWWVTVRSHASYAFRCLNYKGQRRLYQMHREVMGIHETYYKSKTVHVDHINKNGLDNRKENLRICTPNQNFFNSRMRSNKRSCRIKGVHGSGSKLNPWTAVIQANFKRYYLGRFKTKEAASRAYQKAARKYHGEFKQPFLGEG